MSSERLAHLMQAHRFSAALAPDERISAIHESILSILSALDKGEATEGQVLRLLGYQALQAEVSTHAALYRQAAADIRQMQREEH
jgi:hypothetical protein